MAHQLSGQRLKTGLTCYLCACTSLLLIRQVDVLQLCAVPTILDAFDQLGGKLSLSLDGGKDVFSAFLQLRQFIQFVTHLCYLNIGHTTSGFLAVAADERNGGTFLQ